VDSSYTKEQRSAISNQRSARQGIAREKQICHTVRVNLWGKLRKEFVHAFALPPVASTFDPEDLALLEKVARVITRRGMALPALLFLESLGPLNFLGSQVLYGLRPFLELVCGATEMERLAVLLERRDSVSRLIAIIQEQATSPA
jgi:hypothetical protein